MLSRVDAIITVFRSFLLQAVFNFERYQSIGFVFSLLHILKKNISDPNLLKDIMLRHLDIFNTQPYMGCFVIGNVARMEIEGRDAKDIVNIKQALACTYASIGDRIFWSRLRCIEAYSTLLLGIFFYYFLNTEFHSYGLIISAIVPTLLYFTYTVYIRYIGLLYGFECGGAKNCGLDSFNWNRMIKTLSRISFFMSVITAVVVLFIYGYFIISKSIFIYILLPFLSFFIQRFFRKKQKNILYSIGVMMIFCFILSFLV